MWKKLLRRPWVFDVLSKMGALYIQLVFKTSHWQVLNKEIPERYWQSDQPFIVCFWHGRLLMQCLAWQGKRPFHMLISSHSDGQIIAKTVGHFGIKTIPGSSNRGGSQALRSLLKVLRGGDTIGITPDGPRGPRHQATLGVVSAAKLSGLPVVPLAFSTTRHWILRSWDRFFIALPFSRGVFIWGQPITVPSEAEDLEMYRQRIQDNLNEVTFKADEMCGVLTLKDSLC